MVGMLEAEAVMLIATEETAAAVKTWEEGVAAAERKPVEVVIAMVVKAQEAVAMEVEVAWLGEEVTVMEVRVSEGVAMAAAEKVSEEEEPTHGAGKAWEVAARAHVVEKAQEAGT